MSLKGKVLFITGASRGIGKAIALRAARDGARIAIVARTYTPHHTLMGTIYTAAQEINEAGGVALPLVCDVRKDDQVAEAVALTVAKFGGIDIVVNNAGAIYLTDTPNTLMKQFDLMHAVNARAAFMVSQACLPHLKKAENPHILNIAPPYAPLMHDQIGRHVAYAMSKYSMSLCTLGMAAEFRESGIAVNALWPRTTIATAALTRVNIPGVWQASRKPAIMGDAAHWILTQPSGRCTGDFFYDDNVVRDAGITDLDQYAMNPQVLPQLDLFVQEDDPA